MSIVGKKRRFLSLYRWVLDVVGLRGFAAQKSDQCSVQRRCDMDNEKERV